ncbi:MAG: hypothetical protein Q8K85_21810, partial [Hyphomicrobium sp.]|nr:hypothetical protein [Hyphomicrobium sp.]
MVPLFPLELVMQFRTAARLGAASILLIAVLIFSSTADAQSSRKFTLIVTPTGAAAGDKMIPVAASVGVNVVLKNESGEPLSKVLLTAKLNGVKVIPEGVWKTDGDNAILEIDSLGANEEITRRLNLRVEMAPLPPGKQAEVSVEAKIGEAALNASAKFPVGDCVAAFQAALTRLRISTISEVWPTADEMRKPDTTLPRARYFRVAMRRGDLANLDRLAAGYQGRLLSNYDFFTEAVRYTSRRWSDELKAFAGQDANPGLCAVNKEMAEGIRKTIDYVTAKLEPSLKAYARAMDQLRKTVGAAENEDLQKIALRLAAE